MGYRRVPSSLLIYVVLILLSLPAAHPQQKGIVEGKLINETDPSIIPSDVEIDVIEMSTAMRVLKSSTTDPLGAFRIDGLPTELSLMIRANYKTISYHEQLKFDASHRAQVSIEVFEPTNSMEGIQVQSVLVAFQLVGDHLESLETISFNNQTKPPRAVMRAEGNFQFSKPPGILDPPKISITGPHAAMPIVQFPLESPDGQSYYSLYPLRPGMTKFEVRYTLPYAERNYVYRKRFFQDIKSYEIAVIPEDLAVSGQGLANIRMDRQNNIAIYAGGPVQAGTELAWTLSGGTPSAGQEATKAASESTIRSMPGFIGRNALIVGPLLLAGFISILWYAFNRIPSRPPGFGEFQKWELKKNRDQLLNQLASLDYQYENESLDRRDYLRLREQGKLQLGRILMLMKK